MLQYKYPISSDLVSFFKSLVFGVQYFKNIQAQNTSREAEVPVEASAKVSAGALTGALAEESTEVTDAAPSGENVRYYLAAEQAESYPAPCLTLYDNGQFIFTYDVLSSYYPYGTYEIKDRLLTVTTSDKKHQYIFTQTDDATLKFEQEGSSEIKLTDKNIGIPITDGAEFVKMNTPGSDALFNTLQTGDKIEITYEAVLETYPGQTGVYTCKLIEKSSTDIIPESTLLQLNRLGWLFPIKCE